MRGGVGSVTPRTCSYARSEPSPASRENAGLSDLHPAWRARKTRVVRRFALLPLAAPLSALLAVSAWSPPALADDPPGEDRPGEVPSRPEKRESEYKPPPSVRLPTVLGGLAFTAAFWGAGAGTAYLLPDAPAISYLNRPVIGPWQAIYHHSCGGGCAWTDYVATVWYVFDGLAQAGGLGVAFQGLIVSTASYGQGDPPPRPRGPGTPGPRREEAPGPSPAPLPASPTPAGPLFYLPRPVPIGQGGIGLGVGGAF